MCSVGHNDKKIEGKRYNTFAVNSFTERLRGTQILLYPETRPLKGKLEHTFFFNLRRSFLRDSTNKKRTLLTKGADLACRQAAMENRAQTSDNIARLFRGLNKRFRKRLALFRYAKSHGDSTMPSPGSQDVQHQGYFYPRGPTWKKLRECLFMPKYTYRKSSSSMNPRRSLKVAIEFCWGVSMSLHWEKR